jgi:hypothetical protein
VDLKTLMGELFCLPLPSQQRAEFYEAKMAALDAAEREHRKLGQLFGNLVARRFRRRLAGSFSYIHVEPKSGGYMLNWCFRNGQYKPPTDSWERPTRPSVHMHIYIACGDDRTEVDLQYPPKDEADLDQWCDRWIDRVWLMANIGHTTD